MKLMKNFGIALLFLPIILIGFFLIYEFLGLCANQLAARWQTERLQANLKREIPDIQILDVYTESGNTSGTGNHVDSLSSVTFATELEESEILDCLSAYYIGDEWSCFIEKAGESHYILYLNTAAPFPDNLAGH